MNYKIKLTQIKSENNNLRTKTVKGYCCFLPKLDFRFNMYANSLNSLENNSDNIIGCRFISTSLVKNITNDFSNNEYKIYFTTEFSEYKIDFLDDLNKLDFMKEKI